MCNVYIKFNRNLSSGYRFETQEGRTKSQMDTKIWSLFSELFLCIFCSERIIRFNSIHLHFNSILILTCKVNNRMANNRNSTMARSFILYYIILYYVILFYIISHIISYHIIYHVMSRHVTSRHVTSHHIIYHIISYHIISYHILYYIILYYIILYYIIISCNIIYYKMCGSVTVRKKPINIDAQTDRHCYF